MSSRKIHKPGSYRAALIACLACVCCCDVFSPRQPSKKKDSSLPTHGIVDFVAVEGIRIVEDTEETVREILGKPELVNVASGHRYLYYPTQGLKLTVHAADGKVVMARVYGRGWRYSLDGAGGDYRPYSHETSLGLELSNPEHVLDSIVAAYGSPARRGTAGAEVSYLRFAADTLGATRFMEFYFLSADPDAHRGKEISKIVMW